MQLDSVRQQVSLRSYAQKDPKQEYKIEAFRLFERLMAHYARQVIHVILKARFINKEQQEAIASYKNQKSVTPVAKEPSDSKKVYTIKLKPNAQSRNEECSCGSGKKYKHCCGSVVQGEPAKAE